MRETEPEVFRRHGPNLALFRHVSNDQAMWEERWRDRSLAGLKHRGATGFLDEFEYPFATYLPRQGPILEAGCGTGLYVAALRARGYEIEGIDYASETIQRIQRIDASMPVRVGDVFRIDADDDRYSAYISIGVIEHTFEGPQSALNEANRVLRPGGLALIAVPYLNFKRRRLWDAVPEATVPTLDGLAFYQDHYRIDYFQRALAAAGFRVETRFAYSLFGALVRDWRFVRFFDKRHFFSWRGAKAVKKFCQSVPQWAAHDLSHMMMFVARKTRRPAEWTCA